MPFIGLKVSKPNVNVFGAANKDLVFNSDLACLKVVQSGKYDFTLNNGANATYTINHNLGYTPLFVLVYVRQTSGAYAPAEPEFTGGLGCQYEFTDTNLYVTVFNTTGAQVSQHFYWFICYA